MDGSLYHQIGNPTKIMSYSDISSTLLWISGLQDLSRISTELLEFLFIQLRSAFVYGLTGTISCMSDERHLEMTVATFFVLPLALKNATRILLMMNPPFDHILA